MNETDIRYSGPPAPRQYYMGNFLVECPKCNRVAEVTVDNAYYQNNGKLYCSNCSYLEYARDLVRYNVTLKRNCSNCGQFFEKGIPNAKEKVDELTISCPHCGITHTFKPRNDKIRFIYRDKGLPGDPVFNLPLWLQQDVRGHLFWAYNRMHLNEIKKYVQSKLRERQTLTHTTMVERLPNFIKDAKNRASLLKAIEKLERK